MTLSRHGRTHSLKDFVGVYRLKGKGKRAVKIGDGKLFVQRTGGPKSPASCNC